MWSLVQKRRMTCHLPDQTNWVNVTMFGPYGSEHFVGNVVKV